MKMKKKKRNFFQRYADFAREVGWQMAVFATIGFLVLFFLIGALVLEFVVIPIGLLVFVLVGVK